MGDTRLTDEVVKRLAIDLQTRMDVLEIVYEDFPEANEELMYPSASVMIVGAPVLVPEIAPYPLNSDDVPEEEAGPDVEPFLYKFVTGHYDISLQVDLWCGNKQERHSIYEDFYLAFNADIPGPMGKILTLTGYHDVLCQYLMTGFSYEDSEVSSQRQEWRVKIDILANCKAVVEKAVSAILETEVQVEAGPNEPD